MRKSRAFRPEAGLPLEERSVPASFGGVFGGLVGSLPAQDAQKVLQSFGTFQRTYTQDVRSILLPSGTTNPSTNRPAFDQAIGQALVALNTSIDATIANLPTAATLDATIQDELLGTGPNSLKTLLAAVPTPTTTQFQAARDFSRESLMFTNQVANQVAQQVRSAPVPAGTISSQVVRQDLQQVRNAYRTFGQTYNNNVRSILLATGTTPSANRAAFDQSVATALNTLNAGITSALGNLPTSVKSSLTTTIGNDLLTGSSTSGNSLQARLASLQTPGGTRGLAPLFFRIGSFAEIGISEATVTRDILKAVNQFNASPTAS